MSDAKLKFESVEIAVSDGVTTIGRVADNIISLPEDSNISRFHAEIEYRDGDHYLIDLDSSNGTTVNGDAVRGEKRLEIGDKIVFGGSTKAEFLAGNIQDPDVDVGSAEIPGIADARSELSSAGSTARSEAGYAAENVVSGAVDNVIGGNAASAAVPSSGTNPTVLIAGAVCGLAIIFAVAAGAFYATRGSACAATATITKPETGDTIVTPTDIEIKIENGECVQSAVFVIDGEEIASAQTPSFTADLDPKEHPELADGKDHSLQVILIDANGEKTPQSSNVILAFDTRAIAKPPTPPINANTNIPPIKTTKSNAITLLQMQEMAQRLANQFSGNAAYNISNKQFLQEVQKRTGEYVQEGFSSRAAAYRDAINIAFVREQNLSASFGFILAMSRSKFNATRQGDEEGLWRMTNAFVSDNKYNGQCGTETLSDQSQNCAAKAAAIYMKAIVFGVFEGDMIYGAAAFGKTTQDASTWKATLPQNRTDIWNTVKPGAEREQILRFFAAGIVAENPQKFGLAKDIPLSELYRVTQ